MARRGRMNVVKPKVKMAKKPPVPKMVKNVKNTGGGLPFFNPYGGAVGQ